MNKCDGCFGAANGDCDDCPFRHFIIMDMPDNVINALNEVKGEYLINVEESELNE